MARCAVVAQGLSRLRRVVGKCRGVSEFPPPWVESTERVIRLGVESIPRVVPAWVESSRRCGRVALKQVESIFGKCRVDQLCVEYDYEIRDTVTRVRVRT